MTHLVWSPQSVRDLEAIRAYVVADSERYADALVRRIIATVERLTASPESGRIVPERESPEIREVLVGDYRAVYRYRAGTVEIVTVFRGSRQFPEL